MRALFFLTALAITTNACADNTEKNLPQTVEHNKTEFTLCAQERVSKLWFDIVDVGIYYQNCNEAEHVFDNKTKLLRFSYLREVEGQQFTEGAIEYLEDNLSQEEQERCSSHFVELNKVYQDVSSGDSYDLFLLEDTGLKLYLNGEHLHDMTEASCHSTYLNVWFGEESMDSQFKDLADKIKN
ncbi:hypothetical protein DZA50_05830 [Kangiella sp. HD9-110m-PIT-SAG07]|nr:hypothetical protein DZA50_05830 [Kangiella sp. HD9-110m-PIT-SAG07]